MILFATIGYHNISLVFAEEKNGTKYQSSKAIPSTLKGQLSSEAIFLIFKSQKKQINFFEGFLFKPLKWAKLKKRERHFVPLNNP